MEPVEESQDFEVWPDNVEALCAFIGIQTQWKYKPDGRVAGLDYQSVIAALPLITGNECTPEFFRTIQSMERVAMAVLREAI